MSLVLEFVIDAIVDLFSASRWNSGYGVLDELREGRPQRRERQRLEHIQRDESLNRR